MVTGMSNLIQSNTMPAPSATTIETPPSTARRVSDNRRSNKPIMEKRRRARINNSLNELKTLILDAMKKDPARHSKLEKADILEMTVKHLQNLQRQQVAMSAAADPSIINKFRAGFSECASEVGRFPGLDPIVKRRLLQHLANCLNQSANKGGQDHQVPVQVHILPNPNVIEQSSPQSNGGIILSNGSGAGVQLVPTRLPNGDIALVLPTSVPAANSSSSNMPLLVPIPQRTSSTASASSSSNYSPSPEPMEVCFTSNDDGNCQPKPLSLVVRKCEEPVEEEKPWRPW